MFSKGKPSSERLFACTNCHKRCKFEDLSSSQQLCKLCRKQFPSVTCVYCKLEYHPIKAGENPSLVACERCASDLKQYGKPSSCILCMLPSAFNGKKCSRCAHSEKKYGPPSVCEHCSTKSAFPKPDDIKRKVDGKTLCLICTIKYKKDQFKRNKTHKTFSSVTSSSNKRSHHGSDYLVEPTDHEPTGLFMPKKLKLESAAGTGRSQISLLPHPVLPLRDPQPTLDILTSNHILETDRLHSEISSLKKQLSQKDQGLLEKDKQIYQLRAETSEKERDFRSRQSNQIKSHNEQVEQLQSEIRSLRSQLSKLSSQKKASSSASADKQSNLAAISHSLAATSSASGSG